MSMLRSSRERLHRWSLARISADATHIKAVQRYRTPLLDSVFRTVSIFGDEIAYTLGLPIMCWTAPSIEISTLVIIAWALVFYTGHALKDFLELPRPFRVDSEVACLEHHFTDEYGLPSTHAQAAWCIPLVWVFLFAPSNRALSIACYLLYAISISFSRVYLGVHSLIDVFVGSALGLVIAAFVLLTAPWLRAFATWPLLAVLLPCLALATYPCGKRLTSSYRDMASILGVTTGVLLADWMVSSAPRGFQVPLTLTVLVIRVVVGLLVVVVGHEIAKKTVWGLVVVISGKNDVKDARVMIPYKYLSYIGIGFNSAFLIPRFIFPMLGVPIF